MPKMYCHRFQVRGSTPIPFDMLRYDACYPAHESPDASALEQMTLPGHRGAPAVVTFEHIGPKNWKPTTARWDSFMWHAVPGTHEKYPL